MKQTKLQYMFKLKGVKKLTFDQIANGIIMALIERKKFKGKHYYRPNQYNSAFFYKSM